MSVCDYSCMYVCVLEVGVGGYFVSRLLLSFTLAFFWPSPSDPAHYCVALIWRGQDWVQKCIYLPAQIGPLSVWSLLSLLLKDSEQRKETFRECVCVCTWVNWDVSQLAHRPAHSPSSHCSKCRQKRNISPLWYWYPLTQGVFYSKWKSNIPHGGPL